MGLHYKSKGVKKFHSTLFMFDESTNKKLDFIANFEGQSQSVIVEFFVKTYEKDKEKDVKKIKKSCYKTQKIHKCHKNAKKISAHKKGYLAHHTQGTQGKDQLQLSFSFDD